MPVQPRTRQLIFLMLWIVSTAVLLIISDQAGFQMNRLVITLAAIIALVPAAAGHLLVGVLINARDNWRLRHGENVYQEDAHVDDAGFIHISAASAGVNKHESTFSDMVSDANTIAKAVVKDTTDPE